MVFKVKCLENGKQFWFVAQTAYIAINNLLYTLNLNNKDKNAVINKTTSGEHLYIVHHGNTYAVRNKIEG